MTIPLIQLTDIAYRYPLTSKNTVSGLNFKLNRGQVLGVVGVNGSGKTTLCHIIRGFIPSFFQGTLHGEVLINGQSVNQYDDTELSQLIGYIFQNPFTQISGVKETVREEIGYGLENLGKPSSEINRRVDEVISLLNLQPIEYKNPFALSGGQKQLVAIAAILAIDPDIFIFDEPTSQLDPAGTNKVFAIIAQLKEQNKTVIIVEHKLDLMMEYVDQLLVLNRDGTQAMFGQPRRILTHVDPDVEMALPTATQIFRQLQPKYQLANQETVPVTERDIVTTIQKLKRGGDA